MLRHTRTYLLIAALAVSAVIVGLLTPTTPASAADTPVGITTTATTFAVGAPVTFTYAAPSNQVAALNWIGWYSSTDTPGSQNSYQWFYTQNSSTTAPSAGQASGAVTFTTTGWAAGQYKVALFYNDGYTVIGSWLTITLYAAPPDPDVLNVDFGSGAPVDHAQSLTATAVGAPTIADDAATGAMVATFSGSNAYQYDFTSQFSKLTSHLTVECQFRWNGPALSTLPASAFPSICSGEQNGGLAIDVYNNKLNANIYVGGYKYAYVSSSSTIVPGQWYDVIATWDASSLALYLDGKLVTSVPAAGTMTVPPAVSQKWTLGADVASSGGIEAGAPVSLATARVWSTALSEAQVTTWSANSSHAVTVTTSGEGTATVSATSAHAGATITVTQAAATGYHFTGWQVINPADGSVTVGSNGTFTMPNAAVTVRAVFTPATYAVHYDGNGADGATMVDSSFVYDQSAVLAANVFTRDGYDFAGWASGATGRPTIADGASVSNLTATDGATVTLYAIWIRRGEHVANVDVSTHGQASVEDWAAAPGERITLTATPDAGYHLVGWQVEEPSDGSVTVAVDSTFTMPAATVTVKAVFAANRYTVRYAGNGADGGSIADTTFVYDQTAGLAANVFTRDGYVFAGWAMTAAGPVAYADGATVRNLSTDDSATVTLYAQWTQPHAVAGSWPSLPAGFVTDAFHLPAVPVSGSVNQPLVGLWNGAAPTSFTKVSGDGWLSVSSTGVVTAAAPSSVPQNAGEITVSATNGTTTSRILVEVPVRAAGAAPEILTASWNTWGGGSHVTDAVGKNLAVIASRGIDVIGFQEAGATMAQQIAVALGWQVSGAGDLGIVSAHPITNATRVVPTTSAPALAVTVNVDGRQVRVWDVYLDESAADPAVRAAQAHTIATAVHSEVTAGTSPLLLLGDLASSSLAGTFTGAGLTDSFRVDNPDATAVPGMTWPLFPASGVNPDRVDYVDFTGGLHVRAAETLTVGWPSASTPASNSWTSDHAAAVTLFTVGNGGTSAPPTPPTVSVGHDLAAYQVGHGPASAAAFLHDAGATSGTPDAKLDVNLADVQVDTAGWYTALVTATAGGVTSNPVAVAVRVAPVPVLTLASTTATFDAGDHIDEPAVLVRLQPVLDVTATTRVDLTQVNSQIAGTYPVTVAATDTWGFSVTRTAVVAINRIAATVNVTAPATAFGTAAKVTVTVTASLAVAGNVTLTEGDAITRGTAAVVNGKATFTLPIGLAAGSHTLTASYSGSDLLTPAAATTTLTVNLPPAWSASTVYYAGDKVSYQGKLFLASWWAQSQAPGDPNGPWQEIAMTEEGRSVWTASRIFNGGDVVSDNGKVYKALYYTRNQKPGDPNGPWAEQAPAGPNGIAPWTPTTVYNAGDKVTYQGHTYQTKYYTRNQAPSATNPAWKQI